MKWIFGTLMVAFLAVLGGCGEDGDCYYNIGCSLSKDFTWQVTLAARDADCARGKRVVGGE